MNQRVAAVVVTNVGASERLDRCVEALLVDGDVDVTIVVHNGDADPPEFDDDTVRVLTTENRGFGAAANDGIAAAIDIEPDLDAVALLNDDVEVTPGWLRPLLASVADDEAIGAAQPTLALAGSEPALVNSTGVAIDRYGAGSDIGDGLRLSALAAEAGEIDVFTGGAVLLRRSMLDDVGGFDERYFLYYEDVDLALRGRERGWRYRHVPSSVVWHEVGATTSALGDDRLALQERNRLRAAFRFADPATVGRAVGLSVRRLRHRPRRAHVRALVSGLATAPPALRDRFRADRA